MSVDWPSVPLSDLVDPQRGISYGIVQPGSPVFDGVPIVRVSDVRNGRIDVRSPLRVSAEIERAYSRTRLRGGELLITIVGTVGETAIVPQEMAGWNVARAISVLPVKPEIGSYWVQLGLRSPAAASMIQSRLNTTVQATLNLGDLSRLPIVIPPPCVRQSIAAILGALDDKIELNRRTNETLEAMARAIFKDWFVDFGPTRAKMEGRAPYLAPDIWSLFPDRLDADGKPEGWKHHSIYRIVDVIYGAPFASAHFNTAGVGEPLIRIRDLVDESPGVWTSEIHAKGYKVCKGDIVVGMDGEFRAYLWGGAEAWLNQRVCVFAPKHGFSAAFVRNSIVSPLAHIEETETATTVIHLGKGDIDRFTAIVPCEKLTEVFNGLTQPLYDRIVANKAESRTLAATRDLLLPKLMSGEIRVRDAEKAAEAAQ
jgi:type I restriction enzyme S subunit